MEHIRTSRFMKYSHEEMATNVKLRQGHRQVSRQYLLDIGIPITEYNMDKMIVRQNWENSFNVNETFLDEEDKTAGIPLNEQFRELMDSADGNPAVDGTN